MEVTEDMKRMARRICVENGWPVGTLFFNEAVTLVIAAIMETQRRDAELANSWLQSDFDERANCMAQNIRDEILAGEHYALVGAERNG